MLMILLLVTALLAVRVGLPTRLLERFARHVSRVVVELARLLLARLLLVRILVVGYGTLLRVPYLTASGRGRFRGAHSCQPAHR